MRNVIHSERRYNPSKNTAGNWNSYRDEHKNDSIGE